MTAHTVRVLTFFLSTTCTKYAGCVSLNMAHYSQQRQPKTSLTRTIPLLSSSFIRVKDTWPCITRITQFQIMSSLARNKACVQR